MHTGYRTHRSLSFKMLHKYRNLHGGGYYSQDLCLITMLHLLVRLLELASVILSAFRTLPLALSSETTNLHVGVCKSYAEVDLAVKVEEPQEIPFGFIL